MIQAFIAPGKVIDLTGDLADVTIEDIAACLALQVRFNGALGPLSVAEHSIHVADYAKHILHGTPQEELAALLHDAHEALLGDITRPVMTFLGPEFSERVKCAKDVLDRKLEQRFGLPHRIIAREIISEADNAILHYECLHGYTEREELGMVETVGRDVYTLFLSRFEQLQEQIDTTKAEG